ELLTRDGRHLLEVGVTTDGSGTRRTGVDRHEVDQGQHDAGGDVLAVSTAGMLVRRDVWDRLGGLDRTWPLAGDDVDFGWRANAAGERVVVVPRAVVRHAGAFLAGRRAASAVSGRPGVVRRRHGIQVVLANTSAVLVPLLLVRFAVESVLRALVLMLARRPGDAVDRLVAAGTTLAAPGVVTRA